MIKLLTDSRGPILSASLDVVKAKAIMALLNRSIGLLPQAEGDPIKPFAIGIWNDFETLRKSGTSASPLRRAIGAYTHSKRYLFAQPDAFRHDIDGQPVEPVSESDRLAAQGAFLKLSNASPKDPPTSENLAAEVSPPSKSSLIRAGLKPRKTE